MRGPPVLYADILLFAERFVTKGSFNDEVRQARAAGREVGEPGRKVPENVIRDAFHKGVCWGVGDEAHGIRIIDEAGDRPWRQDRTLALLADIATEDAGTVRLLYLFDRGYSVADRVGAHVRIADVYPELRPNLLLAGRSDADRGGEEEETAEFPVRSVE
jgi:hypothetical protein